jgi:hypothetical protein
MSQTLKQEWAGVAGLKPRTPAFGAVQTTVLDNGVTVSSSEDLGSVTAV